MYLHVVKDLCNTIYCTSANVTKENEYQQATLGSCLCWRFPFYELNFKAL